jgi:chromosome segregation ATPase
MTLDQDFLVVCLLVVVLAGGVMLVYNGETDTGSRDEQAAQDLRQELDEQAARLSETERELQTARDQVDRLEFQLERARWESRLAEAERQFQSARDEADRLQEQLQAERDGWARERETIAAKHEAERERWREGATRQDEISRLDRLARRLKRSIRKVRQHGERMIAALEAAGLASEQDRIEPILAESDYRDPHVPQRRVPRRSGRSRVTIRFPDADRMRQAMQQFEREKAFADHNRQRYVDFEARLRQTSSINRQLKSLGY